MDRWQGVANLLILRPLCQNTIYQIANSSCDTPLFGIYFIILQKDKTRVNKKTWYLKQNPPMEQTLIWPQSKTLDLHSKTKFK